MIKRLLQLALFISIFQSTANAQLTQQWNRSFGSSSPFITFPFKALPDNSGNIYCAVLSYFNISTEVCDTLWILKYDDVGNLLWSTPIKEDNGTLCTDFKMDDDSNLVLIGSNFDGSSPLARTFNVIKMDTSGNILWNRHFNDSLQYSRGDLLSFIPGATDMIVTNHARGGPSANVVYVRRLDANGNQLWKYSDTLRMDPGNQWIDSTGFFHYTSQEKIGTLQQRMHYKKLDLNGNAVDSFALDYGFGSFCRDEENMYVDNSGNVFLNLEIQATMLNIYHELLLQLSPTADSVTSFEDANLITRYMTMNPVTQNLFLTMGEGTNFTPLRSSMAVFNQCAFIDTTVFAENLFTIDQFMNANGELYVLNHFDKIYKFDANGNLVWGFPTPAFVNNNDQDRFNYRIMQNPATHSIYYMYADRLVTTDDHGVFQIYKYSEDSVPVSINEELINSPIQIFPNPSSGKFTITGFEFNPGDEIIVRNILGEDVYEEIISSSSKEFQLRNANFNSGAYVISINTEKKIVTQKVLIQ